MTTPLGQLTPTQSLGILEWTLKHSCKDFVNRVEAKKYGATIQEKIDFVGFHWGLMTTLASLCHATCKASGRSFEKDVSGKVYIVYKAELYNALRETIIELYTQVISFQSIVNKKVKGVEPRHVGIIFKDPRNIDLLFKPKEALRLFNATVVKFTFRGSSKREQFVQLMTQLIKEGYLDDKLISQLVQEEHLTLQFLREIGYSGVEFVQKQLKEGSSKKK